MVKTLYTRTFGLVEIFIEINGPCRGWGFDRCYGGVLVTLGHMQVTVCSSPRRIAIAAVLGGTFVTAALTTCGVL